MTVIIDAPRPMAPEPDVHISLEEAHLLSRIKSGCGMVDAIRTLRYLKPCCGLKAAHDFCMSL